MHAKGLLVILLGLGVSLGAAAGAVVGVAAWVLRARAGSRAPHPAALALGAGLAGLPLIAVALKAAVFLRSLPMAPVSLAALVLAGAWITMSLAVVLGRVIERVIDRAVARLRLPRGGRWWHVALPGALAAGLLILAADAFRPTDAPFVSTAQAQEGRPARAGDRPNIILVSLDTLRPDHLSALGYPRITSPHIDSVIQQGVLFRQAIAASAWTVPSHAALMTGDSPSRLGPELMAPIQSGALKLPPGAPCLAELLRAAGYRTAAFLGGATLRSTFGFSRGFDLYDDYLPPSMQAASDFIFFAPDVRSVLGVPRNRFLRPLDPALIGLCNWFYGQRHLPPLESYLRESHYPRRFWNSADEVNAKVDRYLAGAPAGPQFLFIHYFDVHDPYDAPPPFAGRWEREQREIGYIHDTGLVTRVMKEGGSLSDRQKEALAALYDEEIAYMDEGFGRLMDLLRRHGVLDDAIVVLFSDHGESLGEHSRLFHGHSVREDQIRILFSLVSPGRVPAGARVDSQVRAIDIMPTILDLAGVPEPGRAHPIEGHSLMPVLQHAGGPAPPEEAAFSELRAHGVRDDDYGPFALDHFSVRKDGWKYLRNSAGMAHLYDLAADPGEENDLLAARPERARTMAALLDAWLAGGVQAGAPADDFDQRRINSLKGLGYIDPD